MGRPPPNVPKVGDKVKLRGREHIGVVKQVNSNNWTQVEWVDNFGPKLCHLFELEKIE